MLPDVRKVLSKRKVVFGSDVRQRDMHHGIRARCPLHNDTKRDRARDYRQKKVILVFPEQTHAARGRDAKV